MIKEYEPKLDRYSGKYKSPALNIKKTIRGLTRFPKTKKLIIS